MRCDMLDVPHNQRDSAPAACGDTPRHLIRRHATIDSDHADDWNVHNRKDIDRGAVDRHHTQNQNGERHDYERVRLPKRQFNNPHDPKPRACPACNGKSAHRALPQKMKKTARTIAARSSDAWLTLGRLPAVSTGATRTGDLVSEIISKDSPTSRIQDPTLDATEAIQSARKIGSRRGPHAEPLIAESFLD